MGLWHSLPNSIDILSATSSLDRTNPLRLWIRSENWISSSIGDTKATLLGVNSQIFPNEAVCPIQKAMILKNIPDARSHKAWMDSVDGDVEVFGMFEETRLHFHNPHLKPQLVILIRLADHSRTTVKVLEVETGDVMDA